MSSIDTGLHYPIDLNALPATWLCDFVGVFAESIQSGFACGAHNSAAAGVAHMRPMNVSRHGGVDLSDLRFVPPHHDDRRLSEGDVLFNNTNSPELIGKTAYIGRDASGLAYSNHMTKIRFCEYIDPKFASIQLHYLWSMKYFLHRCVKHVNQASISSSDLGRTIPFVAPPIGEQRRIVAKVEELFSELDMGVESLIAARAQIKAYRQCLLKAAFEGELTRVWRNENSGKIDTETALHEYIKLEREQQYNRELQVWKKAVLKAETANLPRPRKPSKPTAADRPNPKQVSLMVELPRSWAWVQLGDFAFVTKLAGFEYTKFVSYRDDGDLEVIKAENAGPDGFRETRFSRIHSDTVATLERSQLHGGELLMVFVGAGTGNVAIVPEGRTFFLGPNIGMMRVTSDRVSPRYVEYFLRSPQGRELVLSSVKAVAQPSLSMGTIRQIPVALPSLSEQIEIVRLLESKLETADVMETEIDSALARAEALRRSILKRAFTGQLVPQDQVDEPATALLDRIGRERQGGRIVKRRNTKNSKKEAA